MASGDSRLAKKCNIKSRGNRELRIQREHLARPSFKRARDEGESENKKGAADCSAATNSGRS